MSKKILFVGLWYHDYTKAIIEEMREKGNEVEYIDIQPRSLIFKIFSTLAHSLYLKYLNAHHCRSILATKGTRFDVVLFLQAHQFSLENMTLLKAHQPQAKFVLYNWDALSNHNYLQQAPFFDKVYTFDRADARKHGFEYLPLFCVRSIQRLDTEKSVPRSVYMVGNLVNPNRYKAIQEFRSYCRKNSIPFEAYLVCSPVIYWRMLKLRIWPRGVHFRSISPRTFMKMIERSAAVFDFANHSQTGYTMRTIENLCAGKKLITSNAAIASEKFYSADRIHCYEKLDFQSVSDFLDQPLAPRNEGFREFHIQNFIATLIGN